MVPCLFKTAAIQPRNRTKNVHTQDLYRTRAVVYINVLSFDANVTGKYKKKIGCKLTWDRVGILHENFSVIIYLIQPNTC
jgi:hypothetical protein